MTYDPVLTGVTAQPMAAIAARVRPEQLSHVVFGALDRVHAVVRTGDYGPFWGDVVLCEGEADGVLDLRIGVGLAQPFPGLGAVGAWTMPAGEAVHVTHKGAYSTRGAAHDAAKAAAARLSRKLTGVHWEVFGAFDLQARSRPTDIFYEAVQ